MQQFRHYFSTIPYLLKKLPALLFCFGSSDVVASVVFGGPRDSSALFPVLVPSSLTSGHNFYPIAIYLILAGAVLSAGVGNLFLYISRRKEQAHLYLAIMCLAIGTDVLLWLVSTAPHGVFSLEYNPEMLLRLDFLAITLAIGSGILLMRSLYPLDFSRRFSTTITAVNGLLFFTIPFVAHQLMNQLFIGFVCLICLFIAYSLFIVVRAVVLRRSSSRLVATACFAVFIAGGIDSLAVLKVLPPVPIMMPFGLMIFVHLIWYAVGRRYNDALHQSEKLNTELGRKARTEQHLRMIQRRLSEFLDKVPLPVCAVDEYGTVQFVNAPAAGCFGVSATTITGCSIDDFISLIPDKIHSPDPVSELCRNLDVADRLETEVVLNDACKTGVRKHLEIVPLVLEDDDCSILILRDTRSDLSGQSNIGLLIAEINRNRQRLQKLDKLIELSSSGDASSATFLQELRTVSDGLEHLSCALLPSGSPDERRELALQIMTSAVVYWEECTGKSRIELLRESGIWRVETTPDGFERSKTLERYLDQRSFPRNPRWKKVLATGDFVLSRCDVHSEQRVRLEAAMSRLRLL